MRGTRSRISASPRNTFSFSSIMAQIGRLAASPCASISAALEKGYGRLTASLPAAGGWPSRSMKPPPTE